MTNTTAEADHKAGGGGGQACARAWPGFILGLLAGLVGWCFAGVACAGSLASPGCLDGGEAARIAAVDPDLGLQLGDGRTVILPGLDAPRGGDGHGDAAARAMLAGWLTGRSVSVRPLAAEPDRWGRTVALVFAGSAPAALEDRDPGRVSVAEALLEAGRARARPDPRLASCWPAYLDLERTARTAGLGLWKDPRYAVIAADDRARLLAGTGTMAIVEGRIVRIVEGRARTYLSFGSHGRADFAISLDRATMARLGKDGVDARAWRGRPLRVRGFLDDRFGLQIELTSIDQIEFTDLR